MIYFIWDSGTNAIKIGFTSTDITSRMSNLQVGNPNALFLLGSVEGDEQAESMLHGRFSRLRLSGEWFRVDPDLVRYVRKAIEKGAGIEARIGSGRESKRGVCATEWLTDRFRERREWTSVEIRDAAKRDGISRNALFSPEAAGLPISKRRRINGQGEAEWYWVAKEDWPTGEGPRLGREYEP